MATVQTMACRVTKSIVMVVISVLVFLCLHESVQAKNIQHHPGPSRFVSHMEAADGTNQRVIGHPSFEIDKGDDMDEDDDDEDDDEYPFIYDYRDVLNSDYYDGLRDAMDARRPLEKRRLRFHKRRQHFYKAMHPDQASSLGAEMEAEYPRDTRAPRLRFVKRDLKKREIKNKQSQADSAETEAVAAVTGDKDNSEAGGHSRQRRSISDLDQALSTTEKRRLSINNDIYVLADMVMADIQRRISRENNELRQRLLRAGKKRSEPSIKMSDLSDAMISQAFVDVLKSLEKPE